MLTDYRVDLRFAVRVVTIDVYSMEKSPLIVILRLPVTECWSAVP